jgi:hypothetical protein
MDPKQRNYSHFPSEMEGDGEGLRIYIPQEKEPPQQSEKEHSLDQELDDEVRWNREQEDINNESI